MTVAKKRKESWKVSESDYKFAEDEVKLYEQYKKELNQLMNEIYYATPLFDNNGGGKSNLPSRPTEQKALSLVDHVRIGHLQRWINAIEHTVHELDDEKERFVKRLFWSKGTTLESVAIEFNISPSTANRWRRAFLMRVAMLTGSKRTPIKGR